MIKLPIFIFKVTKLFKNYLFLIDITKKKIWFVVVIRVKIKQLKFLLNQKVEICLITNLKFWLN